MQPPDEVRDRVAKVVEDRFGLSRRAQRLARQRAHEGALARAVRPYDAPVLPQPDGPGGVREDEPVADPQGGLCERDQRRTGMGAVTHARTMARRGRKSKPCAGPD